MDKPYILICHNNSLENSKKMATALLEYFSYHEILYPFDNDSNNTEWLGLVSKLRKKEVMSCLNLSH